MTSEATETPQDTGPRIQWNGTHEYIVAPLSDTFAVVAKYLHKSIEVSEANGREEKILVILPTDRSASLMYELISALHPKVPIPIFQLHCRIPGSERIRITDELNQIRSAVVFSSDVMASKTSFNAVGSVIHVGVPATAQQYIHCLHHITCGEYRSLLVISPYERFFLREHIIRNILTFHRKTAGLSSDSLDPWRRRTADAMNHVSPCLKAQTYTAFLGYYKSMAKRAGLSTVQLVAIANDYVLRTLRYESPDKKPPALLENAVRQMGLRGHPGLNVVKSPGDASVTGRGSYVFKTADLWGSGYKDYSVLKIRNPKAIRRKVARASKAGGASGKGKKGQKRSDVCSQDTRT
ncbi:hypothetical protein BD410DRAFT_501751 [Rickenella mellea]|uniref:Helicase C-terminal domain-containing protein n=1 Tax=Rickenella mellea TaxID=50990 RepID=A0A4Y7PTG0_9AGAM|nr:hypothetical protein BD410DRAFT_501751 [Rickenella mellea]